jgi:gliding motility-associated-like protein
VAKKLVSFLLTFIFLQQTFATHISGGELSYTYIGPGSAANTSQYRITLRLYRQCNATGGSGAELNPETVVIGIYNSANLSLNKSISLVREWQGNPPEINNDPNSNPCLSPPVAVCYQVGSFSAVTDLPNSAAGYTLIWERWTRINLLNTTPADNLGATFLTRIPGTTALPSGSNNAPVFVVKDTSVVCKSTSFNLDFSAVDSDNDSLAYKFVPAYNGFSGNMNNPNPFTANVPSTYQLITLNYPAPYSGTSPLGPGSTINVNTGLISGVAPATPGKYVICVMAEEWRNGVLINTHRKDFILNVANCGLNGAELGPEVWSCDGFTWTFENQSTSSNINSYLWSFGDGQTSTAPRPTHTYADTGVYNVKLKVTSTGGCQDSAVQKMNVFPGFFPKFGFNGSCKGVEFNFTDSTVTNYGTVNFHRWDFGETTTLADTASGRPLRTPTYTYQNVGTYNVQLIVTNSKGCRDTANLDVVVNDKPQLTLPFKDTLICSIDTLQLHAVSGTGQGSFTWSPNYRISSLTDPNPFVNPLVTTTYTVTLNDRGCVASDNIRVNVLDFITVNAGPDTTICLTDSITLRPTSQALSFRWTPIATLTNPNTKFPIAKPVMASTTYFVQANLGKCQAADTIVVKTAPYPKADAGADTIICFGERAFLNGSISGLSSIWLPSQVVQNPNSLSTLASPRNTTTFVLVVTDTLGCPKPTRDSVLVTVRPQPVVFAGNDTTIIVGQPLVFNSSASNFLTQFQWTPATGMNSDTLLRPTVIITPALYPNGTDQIRYTFTASSNEGCTGSDDVIVKIFKTGPTIFVPTAFTPNGDGNNDIYKPILAGMQRLDYFRIYNRYGQLVYQTSAIGQGWDGRIKGSPQGNAGYVYSVQAVDYNGVVIKQSGSFLLVR